MRRIVNEFKLSPDELATNTLLFPEFKILMCKTILNFIIQRPELFEKARAAFYNLQLDVMFDFSATYDVVSLYYFTRAYLLLNTNDDIDDEFIRKMANDMITLFMATILRQMSVFRPTKSKSRQRKRDATYDIFKVAILNIPEFAKEKYDLVIDRLRDEGKNVSIFLTDTYDVGIMINMAHLIVYLFGPDPQTEDDLFLQLGFSLEREEEEEPDIPSGVSEEEEEEEEEEPKEKEEELSDDQQQLAECLRDLRATYDALQPKDTATTFFNNQLSDVDVCTANVYSMVQNNATFKDKTNQLSVKTGFLEQQTDGTKSLVYWPRRQTDEIPQGVPAPASNDRTLINSRSKQRLFLKYFMAYITLMLTTDTPDEDEYTPYVLELFNSNNPTIDIPDWIERRV
jgi:hypothetical protein